MMKWHLFIKARRKVRAILLGYNRGGGEKQD
jgi:hypothetical protein